MLAAIAHPPHLAGICPVVTASNYHSNWTYQGGAFRAVVQRVLDLRPAQNTFDRQTPHAPTRRRASGNCRSALSRCSTLRPTARPDATQTLAPYFLDWLAHPSEDALLEAVVHRGAFLRHHRAAAHDCRLVRPLPGRLAPQLRRRQGARRHRGRSPRPAPPRRRRRPCGERAEDRRRRLRPGSALDEDETDAGAGTTTCSRASRTSSRASP